MSEYHMPVLSEQERDKLMSRLVKFRFGIQSARDAGMQTEADESDDLIAQIALAALTAEPVEYLTWHQGCRAPDDCEEYSVVAEKGDKSCDGSDAFAVYICPPVPVIKQEGEQRD